MNKLTSRLLTLSLSLHFLMLTLLPPAVGLALERISTAYCEKETAAVYWPRVYLQSVYGAGEGVAGCSASLQPGSLTAEQILRAD